MVASVQPGVMKLCHALSKDSRKEIMMVLYERYQSMRQVAQYLQITTPAVAKYLSGRTHPSDKVMCRALELAMDDDDKNTIIKIKKIIINDMIGAIEEMLKWMILNDLLDTKDIDTLLTHISRYKLALIGATNTRTLTIKG